jgi:hypothetical protein
MRPFPALPNLTYGGLGYSELSGDGFLCALRFPEGSYLFFCEFCHAVSFAVGLGSVSEKILHVGFVGGPF